MFYRTAMFSCKIERAWQAGMKTGRKGKHKKVQRHMTRGPVPRPQKRGRKKLEGQ